MRPRGQQQFVVFRRCGTSRLATRARPAHDVHEDPPRTVSNGLRGRDCLIYGGETLIDRVN